jgi:hypothetical protein
MNAAVLQKKVQGKFSYFQRKLITQYLEQYKKLGLGVKQHSKYDNIFYCCTQKTASQWFRAVFNDLTFYENTGLKVKVYDELGLQYGKFQAVLPKHTIGTQLYISYPTYQEIYKPQHYKTFFVLRDPRDIVVSMYFSAKCSHVLIDVIPTLRKDLESLDLSAGMKYMVDCLSEFGLFEAQRSWMQSAQEQSIQIFRYEDLANDNFTFLKQLLTYLEVSLSDKELTNLYNRHKFESKAKGRSQGEENINSHYRKGLAGDWKNYFDGSITAHFGQVTGNLVETLGYVP